MAIAFDAVSTGTVNTASWTHTCTGSNLVLIVATAGPSGAVTGVTYNGVALTQIGSDIADGTTNRHLLLWALVAPATGAHTVTLTGSLATSYIGIAGSYTGCRQSGIPDAATTVAAAVATSVVPSMSTVATNCWTIMVTEGSGSNSAAGAGSTQRQASAAFAFEFYDSNAALSAGVHSMTATCASQTIMAQMISLAPLQAGNFFLVF